MSAGTVFRPFRKPEACEGCPYAGNGRRFVPGTGELDECETFLVAEKPGENEDREGAPLVGKTGVTVERANGGWLKVFRTNVRKCMTKDVDPAAKQKSIEHCVRAYLLPEMQRVLAHRPDDSVSVTLVGGDATRAFMGIGIQKYHGSTWTREEAEAIARAADGDVYEGFDDEPEEEASDE